MGDELFDADGRSGFNLTERADRRPGALAFQNTDRLHFLVFHRGKVRVIETELQVTFPQNLRQFFHLYFAAESAARRASVWLTCGGVGRKMW